MSPRLSPKSRLKLSQSGKNKSENKINSQTIKPKKVAELVNQFEANVDVMNTDDEGIKKVKLRDAFETLMGARETGDTLSKTPVRKKVKLLENITSKNTILPWVTKSGHKGSN